MVNSRIIYGACPLCGSKDIQKLLAADCSKHPMYKSGIDPLMVWMSCAGCGHVFTEGYFTKEALEIVFSDTQEIQKVGFEYLTQRSISARMVEKVLNYISEGCWLDVGFGNGSLLFTAQEYGFTPVGLDLRAENVHVMTELGVESYRMDVQQLEHWGRFSVISMADVLEHMPYPGLALDAAHRLLATDGVMLLSMPNSETIIWKVWEGRNMNPFWGEIEHYHNFSRTRLWGLLREKGFEPIRYGISERYPSCMEVLARKTA